MIEEIHPFFCLSLCKKDAFRFRYDGKVFPLSTATEEAATFYAVLLEHDYSTREVGLQLKKNTLYFCFVLSDFQQELLWGLEEEDDFGREGDYPRLLKV